MDKPEAPILTVIPKFERFRLPYNIEDDSNIEWETVGKLSDKELEEAIQKEYDVNEEIEKHFKDFLLAEKENREKAMIKFRYDLMPMIFKNPMKLESFFQLEDLVKNNKISVETLKVYTKSFLTQIPCSLFCIIKKLEKECE